MTILFLSRLFYPHIGGVEKHVMEIGKLVAADGHKVIIISEKQKGDKEREIVNNIEILRIDVGKDDWFKKFRVWGQMWKLIKVIGSANIVHCHDVFFWYLPFRFLFIGKSVYTTFHGYEAGSKISFRATMSRKISEIFSWGNICVGEFITKWYGTKPTYVTYGGIDISKFPLVHFKEPQKPIRISFIGRVEKDTGIETYVHALDKLREENIPFVFETFGDGSLLKLVAKYGKANGFVEDISLALRNSDIIFCSSYLTILEAMAAKRLVFAVDQDVLKRDYLEMTPFSKWIVIDHFAEKLAEEVKKYIENPITKKQEVEDAYSWAMTQTWESLKNTYYKLWKI